MNKLAWGAKVSPEFRNKVRQIVADFGWPEEFGSYLMACMAFETGRTFSPKIKNPNSSAIGLIQFMNATLKGLKVTRLQAELMSAEEQLNLVKKYFMPYHKKIKGIEDMYMAILWPAGIGKPLNFPLSKKGTAAYNVNRGLDSNKDGFITKKEASQKIIDILGEGLRKGNIEP